MVYLLHRELACINILSVFYLCNHDSDIILYSVLVDLNISATDGMSTSLSFFSVRYDMQHRLIDQLSSSQGFALITSLLRSP